MPGIKHIVFRLLPLLTLLGSSVSGQLVAQDSRQGVSFRYDRTPAIECIQDLEERYGLEFAYNASALEGMVLSGEAVNKQLTEALALLFQRSGLAVEQTTGGQLLILPAGEAPAPTKERICGTLRDASTGERLSFVNVFIADQQAGAVTNERGYFELYIEPNTEAEITFSFIGYESVRQTLGAFLRSGCPSVELKLSENIAARVLVVDKAIQLMDADNGNEGYQMRPNQIATLPGWGEPDVLRTVQLLPGITSTNELASDLSIRGGTSDQNLILWQDIPLYHTGHFFGLQSVFNPTVVDRVEVHRSNLDAAYGGRVSGLLNIITEARLQDSFQIDAGFNALSFNASTRIPFRKIRSNLLFSLRRSYTDWIQTGVFRNFFNQVTGNGRIADIETDELVVEDFVSTIPDFYFRDQFISWTSALGDHSQIDFNAFAASDALNYQVQTNNNFFFLLSDKIDQENRGWNIRFRHDWGPQTQTRIHYLKSRYSSIFEHQSNFNPNTDFAYRIDQDNSLQHSQFKVVQSYAFSERWRGYTGIELDEFENEVRVFRRSTERVDVNDSLVQVNAVHSFFTHLEIELSRLLELDLGLRSSYYKGSFFTEPRLQLGFHPTDRWHIKGGLSQTHQFLYQIELSNDLDLAERYWLLAFRNFLPVLRSLQTSFGLQYTHRSLIVEVEAYWRKLGNLPSEILPFPDDYNLLRSQGQSRHRGVDFLVKQRWPHLQLWMAYSISHSSYRFPTLNLTLPFSAFQDHRHNLQLASIFELGQFELALSHRYRSGTPFTAVTGYDHEINQQGEPVVTQVKFGKLNGRRLPNYARTDFSAGYQFRSGRWEGKFGVSVFNLFNRVNIGSYDFNIERNDSPAIHPRPFDVYRVERDLMRRTWNLYFQGYF